jgi:hypothetical protein
MTLETTLAQQFYVSKLSSISKAVCERCSLSAKNNPCQGPRALSQVRSTGGTPLENLIMDFTEMPGARGCKCLLVIVPSQDAWKCSPLGLKKGQEVVRCLLKEISAWFGIPVSTGWDNVPAFVAEVVQLAAKGLGITWKLHTAYHPKVPYGLLPPKFKKSGTYE